MLIIFLREKLLSLKFIHPLLETACRELFPSALEGSRNLLLSRLYSSCNVATTMGDIISFIFIFFDGVDCVPNSTCSLLDKEVLIATRRLEYGGDEASRSGCNRGEDESLGEAAEPANKLVVPMELALSPAEEGSVGSNETEETLAVAVSDTMGRCVGVSNVVAAIFWRRLL